MLFILHKQWRGYNRAFCKGRRAAKGRCVLSTLKLRALLALLLVFLLVPPVPAFAEEGEALDNSLQQFKKDMLDVNKRLLIMEEELLFPANAQLTVFLSLDIGRFLIPDSITLEIDGKPVQSHLYTKREVDALRRGAIQRLLTTIVKPGTHSVTAVVAGTDIHGREVRRGATTEFTKDDAQYYLQLRIVDDTRAQQADIVFGKP